MDKRFLNFHPFREKNSWHSAICKWSDSCCQFCTVCLCLLLWMLLNRNSVLHCTALQTEHQSQRRVWWSTLKAFADFRIWCQNLPNPLSSFIKELLVVMESIDWIGKNSFTPSITSKSGCLAVLRISENSWFCPANSQLLNCRKLYLHPEVVW